MIWRGSGVATRLLSWRRPERRFPAAPTEIGDWSTSGKGDNCAPRQSKITNQKPETHGLYACGTPGGNHDHRHSDCALVAGGAGGPRGGPADAVQEQSQATRPRLPESQEHHQAVPQRRLGIRLGGRRRPGHRLAAAGRLDLQHSALHRAAGAARPGGRPGGRRQEHRQPPAVFRDALRAQLSHAADSNSLPLGMRAH